MKLDWDHIKKTADTLGEDLNADAAWDRFEKRREKKERRVIFWWPYGIGVAVVLLGMLLLFNQKQQINEEGPITVIQHSDLNNTDNSATTSETHKSVDTNISGPNNKLEITNNKTASVGHEKGSGNSELHKTYNTEFNSHADKLTFNIDSKQRARPVNYHTLVENINKKSALDDSPILGTNTISGRRNTEDIVNNEKINSTIISTETKVNSTRDLIHVNTISFVKALFYDYGKLDVDDYLQLAEIQRRYRNEKPLSLIGRYSYGIPTRKLQGDEESFVQRRSAQEDFKESNSIEFLISKRLTSAISLSVGLSQSQYRSQSFEVNQELIQNVSFENELLELRVRNGLVQEVRGTILGSQTVVTERIRTQRYFDTSIPIYVNYEKQFLAKWSVSISTGASVSIHNFTRGVTFASTESQGEYQQLEELDYRKRGLFQGLFLTELSYALTPTFSFRFGGHYRRDLNNRFNSSGNELDKFSSYGLSLGLKQEF